MPTQASRHKENGWTSHNASMGQFLFAVFSKDDEDELSTGDKPWFENRDEEIAQTFGLEKLNQESKP